MIAITKLNCQKIMYDNREFKKLKQLRTSQNKIYPNNFFSAMKRKKKGVSKNETLYGVPTTHPSLVKNLTGSSRILADLQRPVKDPQG